VNGFWFLKLEYNIVLCMKGSLSSSHFLSTAVKCRNWSGEACVLADMRGSSKVLLLVDEKQHLESEDVVLLTLQRKCILY
jgi:hypothetical protein